MSETVTDGVLEFSIDEYGATVTKAPADADVVDVPSSVLSEKGLVDVTLIYKGCFKTS